MGMGSNAMCADENGQRIPQKWAFVEAVGWMQRWMQLAADGRNPMNAGYSAHFHADGVSVEVRNSSMLLEEIRPPMRPEATPGLRWQRQEVTPIFPPVSSSETELENFYYPQPQKFSHQLQTIHPYTNLMPV